MGGTLPEGSDSGGEGRRNSKPRSAEEEGAHAWRRLIKLKNMKPANEEEDVERRLSILEARVKILEAVAELEAEAEAENL